MQFPYLTFIESLEPSDLGWIDANAEIMQLRPGDVLIEEGAVNTDLFILESGLLQVYTGGAHKDQVPHEIARIGSGSLVGDLSWLETQVTSASVRALENSILLRLDGDTLEQQLTGNSEFAARFFQGIARVIAQRLRDTTITLTRFAASAAQAATESAGAGMLLRQLEAFKAKLQDIDRQYLIVPHMPADTPLDLLRPSFHGLLQEFNALMWSDLPTHLRTDLGAIVQRELLPYIGATRVAERLYAKPRGYAGDFDTMEMIYRDEAGGHGRLGPLIDRCFLDQPANRAIRNSRKLLAIEIRAQQARQPHMRVTSLACGGAPEMYDVYDANRSSQIQFTALDIDYEALEAVRRWSEATLVGDLVQPVQGNLIYLSTGRQNIDLDPQHLIYSNFALCYLHDQFVIKLLDWIYDQLAHGGRVLLGSPHITNPDKAFFDHVLHWQLIHRSEDDLNRLFAASKFGKDCHRIVFEEEKVMMFAEGVKS
jgi:extracellular factor (EF) 3-hydroxypalmitic acid methyl ester biosynthesis protein